MKVEVSPTARAQLIDRMLWWDEHRPIARVRVEDAFDDALALIASRPCIGRRYTHKPPYRMWALKETYFYVLYRVDEAAEVINIVSVWSTMFENEPPLDDDT